MAAGNSKLEKALSAPSPRQGVDCLPISVEHSSRDLIPIYNVILLLEIAGRPLWWIVLLLIPIVNFVVAILVSLDIAKQFGKGAGFGVGLAFLAPIFYPILGFGDARFQGAAS